VKVRGKGHCEGER